MIRSKGENLRSSTCSISAARVKICPGASKNAVVDRTPRRSISIVRRSSPPCARPNRDQYPRNGSPGAVTRHSFRIATQTCGVWPRFGQPIPWAERFWPIVIGTKFQAQDAISASQGAACSSLSLTSLQLCLSTYGEQNVHFSASLQILTIQRTFLTALLLLPPDNESYGGDDEAEHPAQLQPSCVDVDALCNSLRHPLYLSDGMSASSLTTQAVPTPDEQDMHSHFINGPRFSSRQ